MRRDSESKGLYRRGSIWWLNFQRSGVRNFVSLETEDFAEAINRAKEIRVSPALNPAASFEIEIEAFLAYKRRKNIFTASSAHGRRYILKAFARWIDKLSCAFVTPKDIQGYYDAVLAEHSPVTANSYAAILRSFFQYAVDIARIIRRNPCDGLDMAEESGSRMQPFCNHEQRDCLINSSTRDDLSFVLYCGFHAGLRKNEIIEARPFWFDLEAGLLHLRKTPTMNFKDREERTIPLTAQFQKFLSAYGLKEPFMLHPETRHGKNRYRYDFSRPFYAHVEAQGLPWVTAHTMRHTFASLLASAGVSLYKIAKWLGDNPSVVEKRYASLLPNDPDIERAHSRSALSKASPIST